MKATKQHKEIFKKGSKTYFNSSLFFPKEVREEVSILYGFVRVADDFVDDVPQDAKGFYNFVDEYRRCLKGESVNNIIVSSFVELLHKRNFEPSWVDAFLESMEMDLSKKIYDNLEETLKYIYGSAEVIGLFMSRILGLPKESDNAAKMLGRSMQYINFIRDINEDNTLARQYLPTNGTKLKSLREEDIKGYEDVFINYHKEQIKLYMDWQQQAEEGYKYIPKSYLIPIKTAADCYLWTARKIEENPLIVYQRKVKPSKAYIILTSIKNFFRTKSSF